MVQPSDPTVSLAGQPPVFPTGCAGRITSFAETDDGRYLITLTGVNRFRIREELPLLRGYRRVVPDWDAFARDRTGEDEVEFDRERLVAGLKAYFQRQQIGADWEAIGKAPGERLVASIAMICPFDPSEKQALLEAPDLASRAQLLTAIVEMAVLQRPQDSGARH
jgi:Lon protease-like protein